MPFWLLIPSPQPGGDCALQPWVLVLLQSPELPAVPPATAPDRCLIRTSYMATHTDEMLDRALEVIGETARKLGVIS